MIYGKFNKNIKYMDNVIITNDGLFIQEYNEDLEVLETNRIVKDLSFYYKNYVELSPDLTFGGLLNTLEPHINNLEEHFMADTRRWPLKPFFDCMKNDITEDLKFTEVNFSWIYEYYEHLNRRSGIVEKTMDEYIYLTAFGNDNDRYSISFIELNNLKNIPVKINNRCKVYGTDRKTIILEFDKDIRLNEFISALLSEITLSGSPERMKNQLDFLIKERFNYDESELILWEDIQLEWLDKELETAISEEEHEWAERVRLKIEEVEKKKENYEKKKK
jgi:hypothetical protein